MPSAVVHYDNVAEARAHLKELLDAARDGRPASVRRHADQAVVVDARRLRELLATRLPAQAEVVPEAGGWSIFLPGLPLAADGSSLNDALDEMVDALREYAADWAERLLHAPNHAGNWALVQLIDLCDDQQLKDWLTAA